MSSFKALAPFKPSFFGAAFFCFLSVSSGLSAQGLLWSRDQEQVRREAWISGKAILVLVENPVAPDPYAAPGQGLNPGPLTDWVSRVYLPLRVAGPTALAAGGWKLRSPNVPLPSLLVLNPLGEERGRIEGLPGWQTLREFLRTWTVIPLRSAAPSQVFEGTVSLVGDGEGGWSFSRGGLPGKFLEYGRSGPFLILRGIDELWEVALPLEGRTGFWRLLEAEVWEKGFSGGFE